jgi:hypothetical protein
MSAKSHVTKLIQGRVSPARACFANIVLFHQTFSCPRTAHTSQESKILAKSST